MRKATTLTAMVVVAGVLMTPFAPPAFGAADDGLVARYTFDDADDRGADSSGKGNDLTAFGNPAFGTPTGRDSAALQLSGTNGQYAEIPGQVFSTVGDDFTMEFDARSGSSGNGFFTFGIGKDDHRYLLVKVDDNGNWSFLAPEKLGTFAFSMTAVSGYNKSSTVDASVEVKAEAPVITTPANGSTVETEVTAISGTGLAGATVTVEGDVDGTAKVAADGTWSVKADLGYGNYTVTASQARDGETSAEATSSFTVAPTAPTITGIQDGATYSGDAIPTSVSGTGVNGAVVSVTVNDAKVGQATVKDGKWSVALKDALGEGAYTVVATQTIDSVSSSASVSFAVAAAPAPSPSPTATPGPAGGGNGGGKLPVTGMGDPAPLAWGAVALLLGGVGALGYRRLRRVER